MDPWDAAVANYQSAWKEAMRMELKETIERVSANMQFIEGSKAQPAVELLLAAAKRQLAAEEAQKPKLARKPLAELEAALSRMERFYDLDGHSPTLEIADVLKALRETVVPWLRDWARLVRDGTYGYNKIELKAEAMLRALGEEP